MWLRSEVSDQSRLRLTAKIFPQISETSSKQLHEKSSTEGTKIRRKKRKSPLNCRKLQSQIKPETGSHFQLSSDNHCDSNQFSSSVKQNKTYSHKKQIIRKTFNNAELVDTCIKSSRLREKMKGRGARRIGRIALKQSIVHSRKRNGIDGNNQRLRILHKSTRWHMKGSYYENGGIFNKKNFEKTPICNKKHKNTTEELAQQDKNTNKKMGKSLLKSIQKRRGFSDETTKIGITVGSITKSKLQRKSSFRLPTSKQKCNIKCCDNKCLSKSIDTCTNAMERLDLVNDGKNNLIVMSQYVNPALKLNTLSKKTKETISHVNDLTIEKQEQRYLPVLKEDTSAIMEGTPDKNLSEYAVQKETSLSFSCVDYYSKDKVFTDLNQAEEIQFTPLENSCKSITPNLHRMYYFLFFLTKFAKNCLNITYYHTDYTSITLKSLLAGCMY